MTLLDRVNYQQTLRNQFPAPPHRVVYSKGGMYMAAARISDPSVVIENTLYWAAAESPDEARYLLSVLNSAALLDLVRPLQARGEHNPRHFDEYVFKVPIPLYQPDNAAHVELAGLAARAEDVAAGVELPAVSFQAQRRRVRDALDADGVNKAIDTRVRALLLSPNMPT